jgi:4-amino-4-deoxy-L-arabinose transferase-like glycosyltransferase
MDAAAVRRSAVWITGALVAVTRWPPLARTLWDWDEALFALAVRDYDVSLYHPQPPGFPLFIALAKLVPFHDEFRALQAIVFIAALFVFPAAYFLGCELGASFFVAFGSALVLAFLPNVWFYGGTAFSDVPSLVLSLLACALLLRGRRDARALIAGAIVLGIAAGFRPQNLLIGFVPFVLAFRAPRRVAIIGAMLLAIILIASYGGAAIESGGWSSYRVMLRAHEQYIRTTDSFLAPIRPSLIKVADDFFLRPFRAPAINIILCLLALIALARRRAHVLLALAIFGPFLIFAWLYLDFHSTSRFSIAYMPLFAIFAAEGIDALRKFRAFALAALIALLIVWTWPALMIVHRTISPPLAALNFAPDATIDERLGAHAAYLHRASNPNARVIVREGQGAITFARDRTRLSGIARDRYFEVSVTPGD